MSKQEVYKRDDGMCFYCAKTLTLDEATMEHLLAVVHGGSNKNENLVIACSGCNGDAGAKSVIAKVKLREARLFPTSVPSSTTPVSKTTVITVGDIRIEVKEDK